MNETGIIINPDELHGRNNIPFMESEKKTKQDREYHEDHDKDQVRRYQHVG